MKTEFIVACKADRRRDALLFPGSLLALATVATLLLVPNMVRTEEKPLAKITAVSFESIAGSSGKRVILSATAAKRLGIETGKVGEETIILKQMVGGLIISPMENQSEPQPAGSGFGGFWNGAAKPAPQPASSGLGGFGKVAAVPVLPAPSVTSVAGDAWVMVTLSQGEWDRLAKDRPARVLSLGTRDKLGHEVLALPSGAPPLEDAKRSMLTLYYVVSGKDHGLTLNNRMRVELELSGSAEKQKVVPYAAVYYDGKGAPWVYVNTKPLVFERRRIGIERIVGDLAVLSDGPAIGTPVVTVGAALLYGAEIFGK